jgi:hypothetical protein
VDETEYIGGWNGVERGFPEGVYIIICFFKE